MTSTKNVEYLKDMKWGRFVPALLVWPIWLYTLSTGEYWADVFQYWPIGLAMIIGSFIAGSTPLGGGVVAFPVSVLVLQFSSAQSRDASVLVQSIGMTAASFLLLITKRHLLDAEIIAKSVIFGNVGLLIGLKMNAPATITNLIYTTMVLEFGIVYWYTNTFVNSGKVIRDPNQPLKFPLGNGILRERVKEILLILQALIGGFLTSNVGSGSDIMMYGFGVFVWNVLYPEKSREDNYFTASSVVVMATMSIATAVTRALSPEGIDTDVLYAWGAMGFVVVLGAPIGSLILTPAATPYLRKLFYFLAITQFVLFGILKIKDDVIAWISISILTAVLIIALYMHYKMLMARRASATTYKNKHRKTSVSVNEVNSTVVDPIDEKTGEFSTNYDADSEKENPIDYDADSEKENAINYDTEDASTSVAWTDSDNPETEQQDLEMDSEQINIV
uniref:Membrane transporter protein n=1 Tax=Aplanochytrium stocchinoi TaxID=215587 RepID=A0A7S3PQA9_9STRA|mmetsp:Transcript_7418/g.9721  ORF Transcript_7418/g.9721 Transcript_7418/m.9721 type:complete len:447 (+) Transcript_7418:438-1778(+)|eukprot:CAMPEP_0204862162 /NCGR_PEP_ID=MMETSP1348-20121228/2244_1 /ASSEMBLY_ACC=CAM_ASM_000700 /TAXON_ID=215587 /ORGANISM="Aplanochytrium stocchinoi, Strain GSBS06" /LENGTH=446 /DNA_ID=CAMNT_0052011945 /DNA_START=403 /DNA_END=1743 /DNA_ORIENTATION=-